MTLIERPAIDADVALIAVRLLALLAAIVARLTQALHRAVVEQPMIAMMWLDVITDRGRADDPARFTHRAQRMHPELQLSPAHPERAAVKKMPGSGLV